MAKIETLAELESLTTKIKETKFELEIMHSRLKRNEISHSMWRSHDCNLKQRLANLTQTLQNGDLIDIKV